MIVWRHLISLNVAKKQQQQQQQTAICDKVFKNGPSKVWKTVFKNFEGVWSA